MKIQKKRFLILILVLLFCAVIFLISGNMTLKAIEIDGSTAFIYSEDDLYQAVQDTSIETIKFGRDITMSIRAIEKYTINTNRTKLILDGNGFTFTEPQSSDINYTLRIGSRGTLSEVTFQNMTISGRNHYGVLSNVYAGLHVRFENVVYTGPQMLYNPLGSVSYKDCRITLKTTFSPVGETAEAGAFTLEGTIDIKKETSNADEIFFVKDASGTGVEGKLTVKKGAEVTIHNVSNNYSGMIYSERPNYIVEIEAGASLSYTGSCFILENQRPGNFIIGEGAEVSFQLERTGITPALPVKNMLVGKDAVFHFFAGESNYDRSMIAIVAGGTAEFNNPKSVVWQSLNSNAKGAVIEGGGGISNLDIKTQQINYWTENDAGGFDKLPDYHWRKNGEELRFQAKINSEVRLERVATNYNYAEDEAEPWINSGELNESTFQTRNAKTISFGYLPMTIDYNGDKEPYIFGEADPDTLVKAKLKISPGTLWGPVETGRSGEYKLETDPLRKRQTLVMANLGWLYYDKLFFPTPSYYKVTYDGNGHTDGTPPVDETEYEYGDIVFIKEEGTLDKSGYAFKGWNTEKNGSGTGYQPGTGIKIEQDVTLYAVWEKKAAEFIFFKVDYENRNEFLAGAEFDLYFCRKEHEGNCRELVTDENSDCWEKIYSAASTRKGEVVFEELPAGEYMLVETKAPEGYQRPTGQWNIVIEETESDYEIIIQARGTPVPPGFILEEKEGEEEYFLPNIKQYDLPMTGGRRSMLTLLGIIMIFCCFLTGTYLIYSRKRV